MDDRIGKLEAHVGHLQEDVRRIEHKIDNKIEPKIDALAEKLDAFKDAVAKKLDEVTRERWTDRVWWLTIAGTLLAVMARGFKWI